MTSLATHPSSSQHVQRQLHEISAELRDIEHWRRLVAARLDLAVATVTDVDELSARSLPMALVLPHNLRALVSLPQSNAQHEAAILEQLRDVLHDLDSYAAALQEQAAKLPAHAADHSAAHPVSNIPKPASRARGANRSTTAS